MYFLLAVEVTMSQKLVWYARGGEIARMGPFKTQVDAAEHTMVHAENCRSRQWPYTNCDCELRPIDGAFVWPEFLKPKRRKG
jgi:hypothetical protein